MQLLAWFVIDVVFAALLHPVRDRHPLIVLAYALTLTAGVILVCALIASLFPDSPYR